MVNFLNFEYVLTIHKAGTIRAAADELYISPQALSEHLGKLERELGTPLFHRTTPRTLTEAGEEFLSCAEACLEARRHYAWYLKGVPHAGYYKEQIVKITTLEDVYRVTRGIKRDLC